MMQRNLPQKVQTYMREHLWHKRWQRVVSILACVVVFCTTYALILPAITMTGDTYCGLEEHTHIPEECYERVLICGYDEDVHQHTETCYEARRVLVCGQEETAAHTHSAECYVRELTCGQEEAATQAHSAECYIGETSLTCGQEEQAAHTHSTECYVRETSLTCGQEENSEHTTKQLL